MRLMQLTLAFISTWPASAVTKAQDTEHVEYIEKIGERVVDVRTQKQSPNRPALVRARLEQDQTAEHRDHLEKDADLQTLRLLHAVRPDGRVFHRVVESPEHEDHIETLAINDQRASHPILWFDEITQSVHDEAEALPPPVTQLPEGMKIIEGDLVVPDDEGSVAATFTRSRHWFGGVVPYRFDANVSTSNRTLMLNAMSDWEAVANIDFRPFDPFDINYLYIQNATFNASVTIGRAGGRHDIWIFSWGNYGVLMHELGHALLYYHEQSRLDRNSYVQINSGNISQNQCSGSCDSQFSLRFGTDDEYGPYDFDSVMHYGQCEFSKCNNAIRICTSAGCGCTINPSICTTITVLPPNESWQTRIGQRDHLSYFDQKVMAMVYAEDDYVFLDENNVDVLPNLGNFFDPYWTWATASFEVPSGGTIWIIDPGVYGGAALIDKPMKIRAPTGARLSR